MEFKGEEKGPLNDQDIIEATVCLANAEGGMVLIGVEDDKRITGARHRHGATTDPYLLTALVRNNTEPPIEVETHIVQLPSLYVIAIDVPKGLLHATKRGLCVRRVLGMQGPECLPFYPHQFTGRQGAGGLADYSATPLRNASLTDLDLAELRRLRDEITRRDANDTLLTLDEEELLKALGLVESHDSGLVPTVAGILTVGSESAIRRLVPTHAVAFQVLTARGDVTTNDWFHGPLLPLIEAVTERFLARNVEQEVIVGPYRVAIPSYAREAFREAIHNALIHRDYSRLGAVHIQLHPDRLIINNPGGFPSGITLSNLLVHEPTPRNPRLADIFRRAHIVETTGRGIDKIFLHQLRLGRPIPDYSGSDRDNVRLVLPGGPASLKFASLVFKEDKDGASFTLDELLLLNRLLELRRLDIKAASASTQKSQTSTSRVLEQLVERGLVEGRGEGHNRVYLLSPAMYRHLGIPHASTRARGIEATKQRTLVMEHVGSYGQITRGDVASLCQVTDTQAYQLLRRLVRDGKLRKRGEKRGTYYEQA